MNNFVENLHVRAKALNKKIVFPEGEEPRVIKAAETLANAGLVRPVLLGNESKIRAIAGENDIKLPHTVQVIDPQTSSKTSDFGAAFFQMRKHKGITHEKAVETMKNVLYFGAMMVRRGEADGSVAGSINSTGNVIRAAIQVIGVHPDSDIVSSFFSMVLDDKTLTYADCGVMPSPDANQLSSIAVDAAKSHRSLVGNEPKVAMLSFSSKGSAKHENVDLVVDAMNKAKQKNPSLLIDGELQFDAAYVPRVAARKAPNSPVAGQANVFVFPDLDAGNIAYKITQYLGGAQAFGPILQGLAKPANDLSRGCVADDIVNVAAITAIQSAG